MNLSTREFLSAMRKKDVLRTCLDMETLLGYEFDVATATDVPEWHLIHMKAPKFVYSISNGTDMFVGQSHSKSELRRKFRKTLQACLNKEGLTPTALKMMSKLAGLRR